MDTITDTLYIKDTTNTDNRSYYYNDGCISFSQNIIWSTNTISTFNLNYTAENIYLGFRQRPVSMFFKKEVKWFWKKKQSFIKIQTTCGETFIEKTIKIED